MSKTMSDRLKDSFVTQINQNLGITHKICRLYFADADDRDDAMQEMMYQLWRSYKTFDGRSKFSTWMYRVCLNTALTYKRKDKNEKHELLSEQHDQIADPTTHHKEETIGVLFDAIGKLSPLNKAITLLYLEDMTYEEISGITGLSKSNVSVRLVRIKKELEVEMKKKIKSIEDVNF